MKTEDNQQFPHIGRLGIALLEHITEPVLGAKAQDILREPVIKKELRSSLSRTLAFVEERFVSECLDPDLCSALLDLPLSNLPSIERALYAFYEHPANSDLRNAIAFQLKTSLPALKEDRINAAVDKYLEILRQEIISVSAEIREKIDSLTLQSIHVDTHETEKSVSKLAEGVSELVSLLRTIAQPTGLDPHATYSSRFEREMKSWFDVLGYRFEMHENRTGRSFEWIINVPARRGYDRILVYGVEGEADLGDLYHVQRQLDELRTQEGWLVSAFRISQAARDAAAKDEHRRVFCYTFDELIEENANFSRYFEWLESEVASRNIDQMYVPLACKKEDVDIASGKPIGTSLYDERNGGIDGYVDRWLDDPNKEHLSILGEFGTGKTWFSLHYATTLLRRYREAKARGVQRPRIPLVIPLRDYAKAVSMESLFSEFFFRKYELGISGYSAFELLNRMGKFLLIFDGFDEMAAQVDRQKMINNFWELAKAVVPGSKVLLTCRTEHFPAAKEGRALLRAELKASTMKLTGEPPQFEIMEIQLLDEEQIRKMLSSRTDKETVDRIMDDSNLREIVSRPVMGELVLDAIPDIKAGKPIDLSRVYLYAIRTKLNRDIKTERTFTSLADKLYFLCELSFEMISTDHMTLNYREFPQRLQSLFGSVVDKSDRLDHWQYDMMGQTLLIRNEEGDYYPAHRSLIEFFVAYKFAAELGILNQDFIGIARSQQDVGPVDEGQDYTWSQYFQRVSATDGQVAKRAYLHDFRPESPETLTKTLGMVPMTPVLLNFIRNMIDVNISHERLLKIIQATRGMDSEAAGYLGGNALAIMAAFAPETTKGQDFSGTQLHYLLVDYLNQYYMLGDLGPDFSQTSFERADLSHASLGWNSLKDCSFREAILTEASFRILQYDDLALDSACKTAVLGSYEDIMLVDLETCKLIARDHSDGAWNVAYSPNGDYVAHSLLGGFCLRRASDLRVVATYKNTRFKKNELKLRRYSERQLNLWTTPEFSPDSRVLYVGSNNSVIYKWDLTDQKEVGVLLGHTNMVESLSLSHDGKFLISAGFNELIAWSAISGDPLARIDWEATNLGNAAVHPTDNIVAAASDKKEVLFLALDTLHVENSTIADDNVKRVKFSPDGRTVAFSTSSRLTVLEYPSLRYLGSMDVKELPKDFFARHEKYPGFYLYDFELAEDRECAFFILHEGIFGMFDFGRGVSSILNYHFPDVARADFRGAIGINPDLAKYLGRLGAVV